MKYRLLGNTGIKVSMLGYGCMSLKSEQQVNESLLHMALDQGINFFDTADIYQDGLNETTVGKAFKYKRQQVIIATKAGNVRRPDGGLDWNASKKHILSAAEQSLQRLGTDYIDLYQLHGGTMEDNIDETIEAFELLKSQGKIRAWGISSIRPNVIRSYVNRAGIASVMMQYSLLDRRPEERCLPLLEEHKITVLSRGSIAQGLLTGKPAAAYLDYTAAQVKQAADAIKQVAVNENDITRVALQYVLAQPAVGVAVVGMRTALQLKEMITAASGEPLSVTEIEQLRGSLLPNFYQQHR